MHESLLLHLTCLKKGVVARPMGYGGRRDAGVMEWAYRSVSNFKEGGLLGVGSKCKLKGWGWGRTQRRARRRVNGFERRYKQQAA